MGASVPSTPGGFEVMILARTGGLAASPPMRYTLKLAEGCPASLIFRRTRVDLGCQSFGRLVLAYQV